MNPDDTLKLLLKGTSHVVSPEGLLKKLKEKRPLRIKFGVDPTAPDIHLGHTVPLEKLRQFQELGHQAILLIGDFTAMVGDPTGRSAARPPLTHHEVLANAETYTEQAFKVLNRDQTEIIFNGDWFRSMSYERILQLNARVTLQQILQREDFKERMQQFKEVRLHELQYPLMQGWDSVELKADVEIGGSDQLFNMLVGRDLQKEEQQDQQSVLCMPLLEGLDGVKKMSKSAHNYVGVNEDPSEMFGKIMSISDPLMHRYYQLLLGEDCDDQEHPMEAKKQLASKITARYHSAQLAQSAQQTWESRFSQKDLTAGAAPVLLHSIPASCTLLQLCAYLYQEVFKLKKSNGEIKKQYILAGAVQLNGDKLTDFTQIPELQAGDVLRLSKKQSVVFK